MTVTTGTVSRTLGMFTAARILPPALTQAPETAAAWAAALNELAATDADVVNATRHAMIDPALDGAYLTLPAFANRVRLEINRRRSAETIPAPPEGCTQSERAHWRSAYASVIKAVGGTPEDALDAAINAVPRLERKWRGLAARDREAYLAAGPGGANTAAEGSRRHADASSSPDSTPGRVQGF